MSLPVGANVVVRTDSQYVASGLAGWVDSWVARGWVRGGEPVVNRGLWTALTAARDRCSKFCVEHVRGHAGHARNEMADALALREREPGPSWWRGGCPAAVRRRAACAVLKGPVAVGTRGTPRRRTLGLIRRWRAEAERDGVIFEAVVDFEQTFAEGGTPAVMECVEKFEDVGWAVRDHAVDLRSVTLAITIDDDSADEATVESLVREMLPAGDRVEVGQLAQ